MNIVISEAGPSKAIVKFLKCSIAISVLACLISVASNFAYVFLWIPFFGFILTISYFYAFRKITKIEFEPNSAKLAVIRKGELVLNTDVKEIKNVETLSGRFGTLVVLNLSEGKSFSFGFIGFTENHLKQLETLIKNGVA